MKKIILYLLFVTSTLSVVTAQNISFTIRTGSTPNSAKVFIKTNAAKTGVVSQTLLTFTLPATITPRPTPTFTLTAPFTHLTQALTDPTLLDILNGENIYTYTYYSAYAGSLANTLSPTGGVNGDGEYEFGEISFGYPGNATAMMRLSSLPDGGSSSLGYLVFEMGGVNISNPLALTYGAGSSNSVLGFLGLSYVPLTIILPTKFLSFYATKSNDDTKLTWTVDNEENNNYFEVEGSTDGRTFKTIQRVNALKNGRSSNTYGTTDINISRYNVKTVYYRIKQVEADGNVIYSEVRQVSLTDKNFSASLYPNPVKTITKLVIDAPEAMKATILVRDASGKTVQQTSIQLAKGITQQQIDATLFSAGDYNVTIVSDKLNQTIKLTKAN